MIKQLFDKFYTQQKAKHRNYDLLLFVTFLCGALLIIASYAWFSASLDVKIKSFNMIVSDESGLFISLDGVNFDSSVEISKDIIMDEVKKLYAGHQNQWSIGGLFPVSSNGILDSSHDRFSIYGPKDIMEKTSTRKEYYLTTTLLNENVSSKHNMFIAFDLFLKNHSGAPYDDNLFLNEGTMLTVNDVKDINDGTVNSVRIGFVKMGNTKDTTNIPLIQSLSCNNGCESIIYEPNSTNHSEGSIQRAKNYDINIVDNSYFPTYAVIGEGEHLNYVNGHVGPVDTEHFSLQNTITSFERPIFTLSTGITKFRVYVWLEGQDIDSIDTVSKGAQISININLYKDLAGY